MQDGTPPDQPSPLSAGGSLAGSTCPSHAAVFTTRPQLFCLKANRRHVDRLRKVVDRVIREVHLSECDPEEES